MKTLICLITALGFSALAQDAHKKWPAKYKGFVCTSNSTTMSGEEKTSFEFVKNGTDSEGKPSYSATYTPTYKVGKENPAPKFFSKNFSVSWLPKEDTRIVESVARDDMINNSKTYYILRTNLTTVVEPNCCDDSTFTTTDFGITVYQIDVDTAQIAEKTEVQFHPSNCKPVK